jgi:hypothetical protein
MFGPWLSIALAVSLYAVLGPEHRFVGRWVVWAIGMGIGTLVAMLFVLVQVTIDVFLLAIRQRTLPVGKRAWLMSTGAPLVVVSSYALMPRDLYKYGPWAIVAAVLVPMIVTALGVRIFAGQKIERSSS